MTHRHTTCTGVILNFGAPLNVGLHSNLVPAKRVGSMPLVGARGTGMPEPFEIVDPLERFVEAREEAVSAVIETARQGRQIRPNQVLWLAGAAVFAISTLILMDALRPRVEGAFAPRLNEQLASDTAFRYHVSSRQLGSDPLALVPAAPPRAQSAHAIDPEAFAARSSESQVQTSQKSAPLSTVTSGRQAAAVESSPSAPLKDQSPATAEVTEALIWSGIARKTRSYCPKGLSAARPRTAHCEYSLEHSRLRRRTKFLPSAGT
jgi:hypothetical protein